MSQFAELYGSRFHGGQRHSSFQAAEAMLPVVLAIEFVTHNLEATLPLRERFDLAMSLEVAEHLTPGRAESFIQELCGVSDCVLFGAAIPGQGGTNHIHERLDQGESTGTPWPTNRVHPEVFLSAREELDRHPTLGEALHTTSRLPLYVARSIKKRLGMDVQPRRVGS
jgi:hypothetical protein